VIDLSLKEQNSIIGCLACIGFGSHDIV